MNYYQILGVAPDASTEEIRAAWRRLSMEHHPDRGGDTETMARINAAYECLSDAQRRKKYDQTGTDSRNGPSIEEKAEKVLAHALKQAIEKTDSDAVAIVRTSMKTLLQEMEVAVRSSRIDIDRLTRRRIRLARKDGKPNLVQELIDQQIASIERALATSAEQSEVFNLCISLLDQYEDTQARPEPTFTRIVSPWDTSYGLWHPTTTHTI